MWYVWLGQRTTDVVRALQSRQPGKLAEDKTVPRPPTSTAVSHGLHALNQDRHVRVAQRKNPQQRAQRTKQRLQRY